MPVPYTVNTSIGYSIVNTSIGYNIHHNLENGGKGSLVLVLEYDNTCYDPKSNRKEFLILLLN